jgi:ABC-2 type transport system permease protein
MRKSRTYIGPVAMTLLILAVAVGLKHSNPMEYMRRRMEQDFVVTGSFVNAAFLCRHLLEGITYFFLPLFACTVCGDLLASEAADGTIRTLLCRPVTRTQVIVSKYLVAVFYVMGLVMGTGVFAYVIGTAILGHGSLVLFSGGIWVIPEATAIARLAEAYALVMAAMLAVGSIAFAVSTLLSNSNGAIATAMAVLWGSLVIQEIEYFKVLKPYLLTTHLDLWHRLFFGSVTAPELARAVLVMLAYSVVSFAAGLLIFRKRDILA